jgi:hypothetical protein
MKPLLNKLFFYLASILLVAQTTSSSDLLDWFTKSFLTIIPWLLLYVIIIMFIYAVLRAPLDVLKTKALKTKVRYIAAFLVSATVSDYFTTIASTLFSLLTLVFMLLLPLILILMLYKSFFALVKSK